MKKNADRHKSVTQRIADGTLSIRSTKEFENLIKIFPENPVLFRSYGDFLSRQKDLSKAADAYATAATLFIEEATPLQSIVSKVLEWRILKPNHEEVIAYHASLSRIKSDEKPALAFWTRLSYPELLSFMLKLTLVRVSPEKFIQNVNKEENSLYFVVSGALQETTYTMATDPKSQPLRSVNLAENDFFGTIFPIDQKQVSSCDIQALTRVELIKISRPLMAALCKMHPNLNLLIPELYRLREEMEITSTPQVIRRNVRHHLPTQATLKILREDEGQGPLLFEGFADNISLGGACVVIDKKIGRPGLTRLQGKNAKMVMKLLSAAVNLAIAGKIVWAKEYSESGKPQTALGVHFKEMTDLDRELLDAYCSSGEGEQNLMWGLWESLVKQ